jgi:PAS domain S-box-containing protein
LPERRAPDPDCLAADGSGGESWLRLLTDNAAEAFWVRDLESGRALYVSPAYQTIFGRPRAELDADPASFLASFHPEDRERATRDFTHPTEPLDTEYRIVRPDGELRWIWVRRHPVRDPDGRLRWTAGFFQDVTGRHDAEDALRRSERLLADAMRRARLGYWARDLHSGIVTCSEQIQEVFGAPAASLTSFEDLLATVHPDDRQRVRREIESAERSGGDFEHYYRVPVGNEVRVIHELGSAALDPQGVPERLFGSVQDVTERWRLEEQLRHAQKMEAIGQLAGGVAHDFNNLLTVILAYAEAELAEAPPKGSLRESLCEIRDAAERAAALTGQLLIFSRRQLATPSAVDLNTVVAAVERMLRRVIGEDIELVVRKTPDLWPVFVDASQIEQILLNLAVNARDAMPRGGRLRIQTRNVELDASHCALHPEARPGPHVLLAVVDSGIGMDATTRSRAFEPFFTSKSEGRGSGLGLPVVYGIASQFGGHVEVESEPGRGASFRVYLPKHDTGAATSAQRPGRNDGSVRGTVLLVEDEEAVRRIAAAILRRRGYAILEARDGGEALERADAHAGAIDLLLTDVVMPGLSGRELAARLRERRPRLPVLFFSGYADDAASGPGAATEEERVLRKPFSAEALVGAVREALEP